MSRTTIKATTSVRPTRRSLLFLRNATRCGPRGAKHRATRLRQSSERRHRERQVEHARAQSWHESPLWKDREAHFWRKGDCQGSRPQAGSSKEEAKVRSVCGASNWPRGSKETRRRFKEECARRAAERAAEAALRQAIDELDEEDDVDGPYPVRSPADWIAILKVRQALAAEMGVSPNALNPSTSLLLDPRSNMSHVTTTAWRRICLVAMVWCQNGKMG